MSVDVKGVEQSADAGTYFCNELYYRSLDAEQIETGTG